MGPDKTGPWQHGDDMSQPLIEIKNLTKRYGSAAAGILAVDGINMNVRAGDVLGFLGPNGAGKSTTMKMVAGYLAPTAGSAKVCGHDVQQDPIAVKERLGYLPEGAPLYPDMTPESFLGFVARVRGLRGGEKTAAIGRAIERTNLEGVLRQPIDTLSKGYKRRVGLAQAILHEPDVLILDEPTDGLDPNQKHEVRGLIRELAAAKGKAVVLSTHILEEVEAVCTRAVIIAGGRIVADSTPSALLARSKYHNAVTVALCPPAGTMIFDELRSIAGVREVEDGGATQTPEGVEVRCTVIPEAGVEIAPRISDLVSKRGWRTNMMRVESGRLDDVFRTLTTHKATGGAKSGKGAQDAAA